MQYHTEQIQQEFPQLPPLHMVCLDSCHRRAQSSQLRPQQKGWTRHEDSTELWSSQEQRAFCMKTRMHFDRVTLIFVRLLSKELQLYWLPFQSWRIPTSQLRELPWKQAAQFLCWKEPQKTVYIILHYIKSQ